MKILVTGHLGYIGVEGLAPLLVDQGRKVVDWDTDYFAEGDFLAPPDPLPNLRHRSAGRLPRSIWPASTPSVHLAALSNDPLSDLDPNLTYDINHAASVRLAHAAKACRGHPVRVLVVVQPVRKDHGRRVGRGGAAFNPLDALWRVQGASGTSLVAARRQYVSPVYLRNATAYGLVLRQVSADVVVNNLVAHAVTTGKVMLQSDGTPWRPLVHVLDIAQAFVAAFGSAPTCHSRPGLQRGTGSGKLPGPRTSLSLIAELAPGCVVNISRRAPRPTSGTTGSISPRSNGNYPGYRPQWTVRAGDRATLGGLLGWRHVPGGVRGTEVLPPPDHHATTRSGRPRHDAAMDRRAAGQAHHRPNGSWHDRPNPRRRAVGDRPRGGVRRRRCRQRLVSNAGSPSATFERSSRTTSASAYAAAMPHCTSALHLACSPSGRAG